MYNSKLSMFFYVLVIHNKGGQAYLVACWQLVSSFGRFVCGLLGSLFGFLLALLADLLVGCLLGLLGGFWVTFW